ncbi:hypothetical protein [uncultured Mediterranean phage uvDeep-CGR2-KM19-C269]|nr:hypothetical protein [uncultured Mediterranean phage uvDeep-CGR2-KM19-C269]
MNKNFFATEDVRKERLAICESCPFLFKPTFTCRKCMCFMKIKSSISSMRCPDNKWLATNSIEPPNYIPPHLEERCIAIWEDIKTGKAKNNKVKKEMIELYNAIFKAHYQTNTNCASCLAACYKGIKRVVESFR